MSDLTNTANDSASPSPFPWALWVLYVSGEQLTEEQRRELIETLRSNPMHLRLAREDRFMDSLLALESESQEHSESFVQRTLRRCQTPDTFTSQVKSLESPSSLPPNAVVLKTERLRNITKERLQKRNERASHWRVNTMWIALAAVLLVSITGVGFLYRMQLEPSNSLVVSDDKNSVQNALENSETSSLSIPVENLLDDSILEGIRSGIAENQDRASSAVDHESNLGADIPATDEQSLVYAMVTDAKQLDAESNLNAGTKLGPQSVDLQSGELTIALAGGASVRVFAPCRWELLSPNELRLLEGEVSVSVLDRDHNFKLRTPEVIIKESATVYDVVVESSGRTDVEVRRGRITVEAVDFSDSQAWKLDADTTNSLTIYTPNIVPDIAVDSAASETVTGSMVRPLASIAKSLSGERTGVITFDGKSLSFDDETVFAKVRDQVFAGAELSREMFAKNWGKFVESYTSQPQPSGSITLNGKEYSFENYNEAVLAQGNVLAQFAPVDKSGPVSDESVKQNDALKNKNALPSAFQGTLFIGGKRRDFYSFEEYQAAMRELMGPAAEFGFFPMGR